MHRKLLGSLALSLGLGMAVGLVWLLAGGPLPLVRAETIYNVGPTYDGVTVDAFCTLREAVLSANGDTSVGGCSAGSGADLIQLRGYTYVLTVTGTGEDVGYTGDLDVTEALTIAGEGPDRTVIDASGLISDRVFHVHSSASTVVISGVKIVNGNVGVGTFGGGIYNDADLTLINCVVATNTAAAGGGGGVYVETGRLTLEGSQIVSNTTGGGGGGLHVAEGSATLNGSHIVSNVATSSGGGVYVGTPNESGALTLTGDSLVAYNTASGISADGGGVSIINGHLTADGGAIVDNVANRHGGGVYLLGSSLLGGSLSLSGTQVATNTAGMNGGGVYMYYGSATLDGGRIASNTAEYGGGVYAYNTSATFTQTGASAVANNHANQRGGGVFVRNSHLTLSAGEIVSNTADGLGGGVYVDYGSAMLAGGQILSNTSGSQGGGVCVNTGAAVLSGGRIAGNVAGTNRGGGVAVWYGGTFTQTGVSTITHNAANDGGGVGVYIGRVVLEGGVILSNTATDGGGVHANGFGSGNEAYVILDGGQILSNTANNQGGGVYVGSPYAAFTQTGDSLVAYNVAEGIALGDGGGGVYVDDGSAVLNGGQVANNTANDGGGLYVNDSSAVVSGAQVLGNVADRGGGAFIRDGSLTFSAGQIAANAAQYGGGVYLRFSTAQLEVTGAQILSNTAGESGGGICVNQGSATLDGAEVRANVVTDSVGTGGGIAILNAGDVIVQSGWIVSNTAGFGGGVGLQSTDAIFTQTGATRIVSNTARSYGGGVSVAFGRLTLDGAQIVSNTATLDGGGLYASSSGNVRLDSVLVEDNVARGGGGLHNLGGTLAVVDSTIRGNRTRTNTGGGVSGESGGTVVLMNTTVTSNTANLGGGGISTGSGCTTTLAGVQVIHNAGSVGGGLNTAGGTLHVINSTVSQNWTTAGAGGGLRNDGSGTMVLTYTTVASNTAASGSGGIANVSGAVHLLNSLVAHNSRDECSGNPTSHGYNLDSDDTCNLNDTNDVPGAVPLLGPLTYEAGTWIHPLLAGSPAIEGGTCLPGQTTVDQRGVTRPEGIECDIGAYEFEWQEIYLPLVLRNS